MKGYVAVFKVTGHFKCMSADSLCTAKFDGGYIFVLCKSIVAYGYLSCGKSNRGECHFSKCIVAYRKRSRAACGERYGINPCIAAECFFADSGYACGYYYRGDAVCIGECACGYGGYRIKNFSVVILELESCSVVSVIEKEGNGNVVFLKIDTAFIRSEESGVIFSYDCACFETVEEARIKSCVCRNHERVDFAVVEE